MSILGNILWFIFGGLLSGLSWILSGVIWCITIVGIPYGRQCFKFASMSFAPFGKEIVTLKLKRGREKYEIFYPIPSMFLSGFLIDFMGITVS